MYAATTLWVDALDDDVFSVVTDCRRWREWFDPAAVPADTASLLADPGQRATASVSLLRRGEIELQVIRRLRNIVTIGAFLGGLEAAQLTISTSPWNGGCMVELSVDAPGRWPTSSALRRRLGRNLVALAGIVDRQALLEAAPGTARQRRPRAFRVCGSNPWR